MNKKVKIIIGVIIGILVMGVVAFGVSKYFEGKNEYNKNYKSVDVIGAKVYKRLNLNTWDGEYTKQTFLSEKSIYNLMKVVSYEEYCKIIDSINSKEITKKYSNKNSNYVILSRATGSSSCDLDLIDYIEEEDNIIIYGDEEERGVMAGGIGFLIAIPTQKSIGTKVEYRECYSEEEIYNLKKYNSLQNPNEYVSLDKPIIYIYPEQEEELTVQLTNPSKITCSYPKYKTEWRVLAKPNGDLLDLDTNRNLYALYYECDNTYKYDVEKEGFVVKGEDTIRFLEEKLEILGLNEREAEEFIVYWLPKLEANKYNYIRFASKEEIDRNMGLEISKKPETLIRILMTYKGLENPIEVEEQKLEKVERKGYTVIEWGGSEIK